MLPSVFGDDGELPFVWLSFLVPKMGGKVAEDAGGRRGKRRGRKERRREKEESFQGQITCREHM